MVGNERVHLQPRARTHTRIYHPTRARACTPTRQGRTNLNDITDSQRLGERKAGVAAGDDARNNPLLYKNPQSSGLGSACPEQVALGEGSDLGADGHVAGTVQLPI